MPAPITRLHPMALLHARSMPAMQALELALVDASQVSIKGLDDGDIVDLVNACRAMTYACPDCGDVKAASEYSRHSMHLSMCIDCMDQCERENAIADGPDDIMAPHTDARYRGLHA